jgi:hypothetical protein
MNSLAVNVSPRHSMAREIQFAPTNVGGYENLKMLHALVCFTRLNNRCTTSAAE